MSFFEFISQIDNNLQYFILEYHHWIYFILFLMIFIKTGIGFLSFVPGETLLISVGIMASKKYLETHFCLILLSLAAVWGNLLNYLVGKYLGSKVLHLKFRNNRSLISYKQFQKAQNFYQKHGAKTLILVRFIPIFRSLAPFTAGMSKMNFSKFILYNVVGGFLWITTYLYLGYFFGNIF